MGATSDEKLYKRKLNEFDQELKRLQRELAKLKILKREGGRARKQLLRNLQREQELHSMLEDEQRLQFESMQTTARDDDEPKLCCKKCNSKLVKVLEAGSRSIIVCQDCESRYTIVHKVAETA